ncbi:MAG TPA: DUF6748 domain-containing protein [Polyangiaceae bacterium]
MRKTATLLPLSVTASILGLSSCAADSPPSSSPQGGVQSVTEGQLLGEAEQGLSTAGSTYFTLSRDVRKCASPLCGGFWVKAVNRLRTTCVDGRRLAQCYVAELDSSRGLSEDQLNQITGNPERFLLAGSIVARAYESFSELGVLDVIEARVGHVDSMPTGIFFQATNNGRVCVTSPCLSYDVELLNAALPTLSVADIALASVASDPSDGYTQLNQPDGLFLAAHISYVRGPAGVALALNASEYYLPLAAPKQTCGSRGLPECPDGSYCNIPIENDCGSTDRGGTCEVRPDFCTREYNPVCGCDGKTYGNTCEAAAAGVSVRAGGACDTAGAVCGTIVGLACAEGQYCDFGLGQCQVADAAGTCQPVPEVCPTIFNPVCGCDGKTYSNACSAASAGISVDHAGAC